MTDESIESEIQAKGLTAPRITPQDIERNIVACYYFTGRQGVDGETIDEIRKVGLVNMTILPPVMKTALAPLELLTFCVLVLRNGFTVTGESACASPENFDAEIGRKIARANAVQKIWPLMGYALKDKIHKQNG